MRLSRLDLCKGVDPMGRGRAKAKQTKVARELKYRQQGTDFTQLQRELHGDELSDGAASTLDDTVDVVLSSRSGAGSVSFNERWKISALTR